MSTVAFAGDEVAPFFGFIGAAAALVFSCTSPVCTWLWLYRCFLRWLCRDLEPLGCITLRVPREGMGLGFGRVGDVIGNFLMSVMIFCDPFLKSSSIVFDSEDLVTVRWCLNLAVGF